MKRIIPVIILEIFCCSNVFGSIDGSQPYTPTALEWAALHCYTATAYWSDADRKQSVFCVSKPPSTIEVLVRCMKKKDCENEKAPDAGELLISMDMQPFADKHGWHWLKLEKRVQVYNKKNKSPDDMWIDQPIVKGEPGWSKNINSKSDKK